MTMASHELIDAQFDRAVQIVQSLPKTGPIQTDYEEKLMMYSLFKQATVGNVHDARPGIWDMLGRAKWDAWAKHKDVHPYQAKQLYVEALLKVLRRYSGSTNAGDLVEELISLGDTSIHRSSTRSPGSDSSSSSASIASATKYRLGRSVPQTASYVEVPSNQDELEDEAGDLPRLNPMNPSRMLSENRPPSSLSSRYRTPLAGSIALSPSLRLDVPPQQPLPGFETPSAFAESDTARPLPGSFYQSPRIMTPPYRGSSRNQVLLPPPQHQNIPNPNPNLERAVESVQIQLAAVTERLETLESRSVLLSRSNLPSLNPHASPTSSWLPGQGGMSQNTRPGVPQWDIDDLGMWSLVLNPLSRGVERLKELSTFFARNENRSPSTIIIRRLCLDISFLLCVITTLRTLWLKSGVRRREVKAALIILWRAIVGIKVPRDQLV